jgi:hypothetical protein
MKQTVHSLKLDRIGYEVSLLRVAPGMESKVAAQLKRAITAHTPSPPICVLKLFGRYDLCAIYETKNFFAGPSKEGPIDGIRGGTKIHAFHWLSSRERHKLAIQSAKGSVYALLFFRFNEELISKYGADIENQFAKYWNKYGAKGVTLDVLGTTGWAEILFVLRGETFKEVTEALAAISSQCVILGETERQILPSKTYSLIGLDFSLTVSTKRSLLRAHFPETFRFGRAVFPTLSITCPAGNMASIYERAKDKIGPGAVAFGATDLLFCPKRGSWGDFIGRVLYLRRGLSKQIYSTSISIFRADDDLSAAPHPFVARHGLQMSSALKERLPDWGLTLEQRLRNIYFGVSNLMQDPLIGACFEDLRPLLGQRLPALLTHWPATNETHRKFLRTLLELVDHAARERAHGAFLALEQQEGSLSPTKGGIQRILAAASLIPSQLLSNVNKKWYGLLIAGHPGQVFSSCYEIINLPVNYLFAPEQWCGLFHETGHALLYDTKYFNIDSARMTELLHAASGDFAGSYMFKLWKDFATEVWADMFDLYFCYGTSFEFYLTNIWDFLPKAGDTVPTRYFLRYFIMHEYWKHLLRPRRHSFPRNVRLRDDVKEFVEFLRSHGQLWSMQPGIQDEACAVFERVRKIVEFYHARFRLTSPMNNLVADWSSRTLRKQLETVLSGAVCLDPIHAPVSFVLALKKHEKRLTLSSRLAAIFSLWHTAVAPLFPTR